MRFSYRCDAYVVVKGNHHTVYKPRDFHKTSHRMLCTDIHDGIKEVYGGFWRKGSNGEPVLDIIVKFDWEGEPHELK